MRVAYKRTAVLWLLVWSGCDLDFDRFESAKTASSAASHDKRDAAADAAGEHDARDGGTSATDSDSRAADGGPGELRPADGGSADADGCTLERLYADHDRDGFGDPHSAVEACGMPDGYVTQAKDCDDDCETCFVGATEACDGKDNDCDDAIDEGLTEVCGSNTGVCKEGLRICTDGAWSDCVGEVKPSAETCDGELDENCNGTAEEGCPCDTGATQHCGAETDVGECEFGVQRCVTGTWSMDCTGATGPVPETCNGKDDDCDGDTDQDLTRDCGSDVGECAHGTETCADSAWGKCIGAVPQGTETCNNPGQDDDCDGTDDDVPMLDQACTDDSAFGICRAGTWQCAGGAAVVCVANEQPQTELCDSIDQDCDGDPINGFDLSTDEDNCGECGYRCNLDEACCGGVCHNLNEFRQDPDNCGACGKACASNAFCCQAMCVAVAPGSGPPTGAELCQCGVQCADGEACCGKACIDLAKDPKNCGACGNDCTMLGLLGNCSSGSCI